MHIYALKTWKGIQLLILFGYASIQIYPELAKGQVLITGSVQDSITSLPLASAHVILEGSNQGTITNRQGQFGITIPSLPASLIFRHIGYHPVRVEFRPNSSKSIAIALQPVPIQLPELLITGDYLATAIMEEVIRRKASRRLHLQSHQASVYSRITLLNRDRIVLVNEAVFDRYFQYGRGIRSVIRSQRSTSDFHQDLGLSLVPQDFSSDLVQINGISFFGPTHPDALNHYTFTFAGRRYWNNQLLFDIYVAPKTNQEGTLIGRISVIDSLYAMVETDLKPASHVIYPPDTRDWRVSYRQNFAQVDSFWLPIDLQLQGWIHVEPEGQRTSSAVVEQNVRLTDYITNEPVPQVLFTRNDKLQIDTVSVLRDDLFLMGLDMIALTELEAEALDKLRWKPTLTLRQAFPPRESAPTTSGDYVYGFQIGDPPQFTWPSIFGLIPWVRYNRVDGVLFGGLVSVPFRNDMIVSARVGQSLQLGRTRLAAAMNKKHNTQWNTFLAIDRNSLPQNGTFIHSEALNSLSARFFAHEYFDWHWSLNIRGGAHYQAQRIRMTIEGNYAWIDSLGSQVQSPWPLTKKFPDNPSIMSGRRQSIGLRLATGDPWQPYHINPSKRAELRVEYANSPGHRSDLKALLLADYHVNTLMLRRPKPAGLALRFHAGIITHNAPRDRLLFAEGTIGPIGELGVLRSVRNRRLFGHKIIGLHWEHDFRSLLFEGLRMNFLVDQNVSLRLGGAHANIDGQWIQEVTLSISRQPLRINITRRVDQQGLFVGFGYVGQRRHL
ncbi:MAG: DUF5686 family protein [Bacteroidetes bacterium]|nr:DUF5686 family protein [Bacteroidota bacterium]